MKINRLSFKLEINLSRRVKWKSPLSYYKLNWFIFPGSLIPTNCVGALCSVLKEDCSKTYTETHKENERPAPKEEAQAISTLSMPVLM